MEHTANLRAIISATIQDFQAQLISSIDVRTFDFDCGQLNDYTLTPIDQCTKTKPVFDELKTIKGPVLYWIEIISDVTSKTIYDIHETYRNSNQRPTPAIKKFQDNGSRVLYVGKVKRYFYGRVIQHLGFHKNAKTQGLQLYHWSRPIGLKVRFHVIEFNDTMENILPLFELAFAKKMMPILGKHK